MAHLKIESTNPSLSFILSKNPESGMQLKSMRQGVVSGWFHNGTYNMYFKDSPDEISFKESPDAEYEYLSVEKYVAPVTYITMINLMLGSALKQESEHDTVAKHTFTFLCRVEIPKYIKFFNESYPTMKIDFDPTTKDVGIVTITANNTFFYALNFVMAFLMFNALISDNRDMSFNQIDDNQIEKYLKSMKVLGDVYFPLYLFKKNMIKSPKKFHEIWKNKLDTEIMKFEFGGTAEDRKAFVSKHVDPQTCENILDIGCGEGTYVFQYASKLKDGIYHAIDIDEECRGIVERKAKHRELDNVAVYSHIDEFESEDRVTVLMIEVIEHMEEPEAKVLLRTVLDKVNFDKIVITTPNCEFNKFYGMSDNAMRHDDHKFEWTSIEFYNKMKSWVDGYNVECRFNSIGDEVLGIRPQHTVVITSNY